MWLPDFCNRIYTATSHPPTPSPSHFAFGERDCRFAYGEGLPLRLWRGIAASLMERDCRFALGEGYVFTAIVWSKIMPKLSVYRIFSLLFLLATATMLQAQTPPSPPIVSDFDWSADRHWL